MSKRKALQLQQKNLHLPPLSMFLARNLATTLVLILGRIAEQPMDQGYLRLVNLFDPDSGELINPNPNVKIHPYSFISYLDGLLFFSLLTVQKNAFIPSLKATSWMGKHMNDIMQGQLGIDSYRELFNGVAEIIDDTGTQLVNRE